MTSIKLDNNMDIVFYDGVAELVSATEDIIQAIRVELEQNKGQWILGTDFGTPYLNKNNTGILQQKDENRMRRAIFNVISRYNEVERINKIEFIENRVQIEIVIAGEAVTV